MLRLCNASILVKELDSCIAVRTKRRLKPQDKQNNFKASRRVAVTTFVNLAMLLASSSRRRWRECAVAGGWAMKAFTSVIGVMRFIGRQVRFTFEDFSGYFSDFRAELDFRADEEVEK